LKDKRSKGKAVTTAAARQSHKHSIPFEELADFYECCEKQSKAAL